MIIIGDHDHLARASTRRQNYQDKSLDPPDFYFVLSLLLGSYQCNARVFEPSVKGDREI